MLLHLVTHSPNSFTSVVTVTGAWRGKVTCSMLHSWCVYWTQTHCHHLYFPLSSFFKGKNVHSHHHVIITALTLIPTWPLLSRDSHHFCPLCVLWTLNLIALQEAGTCGDLPGSVTTRPTAMCLQEGQAHVLVVQSLLRML